MAFFSFSKPMESPTTTNTTTNHSDLTQNESKECDMTIIAATKQGSSLRTPSFSSSSSSFSSCSSSYFPDDSPFSPATPLRLSGVPFSWEHLPGIPKKSSSKKKDTTSLMKVLPLPPPAMHQVPKRFNFQEAGIRKKNNSSNGSHFGSRDPFFAALIECSKDDNDNDNDTSTFWNGDKVTRSISDRFGFINLYASCKRTCAVSESIVYIPRSNRTSFDLITRRSR